MRKRARTDRNQSEIVTALRRVGASVQVLSGVGDGCPDLLVGVNKRNFLLEVKDGEAPPSAQVLTEDEAEWHAGWNGSVETVGSIIEAFKAVGLV